MIKGKMFGKSEKTGGLLSLDKKPVFLRGDVCEWTGLWASQAKLLPGSPLDGVSWGQSQELLPPTWLRGREEPGPDGPFGQECRHPRSNLQGLRVMRQLPAASSFLEK